MTNPNEPIQLDPTIEPHVYIQNYSPKQLIEGVKLSPVKNIVGEDGSFSEVIRLNEQGELEQFPGFKLAQVNRTTQLGGTVKAWHLHFLQDEVWYIAPPFTIFVGLWDVRNDSPTKGLTNRLIIDGNNTQLLYIPRGVAHGSAVLGHDAVNLYYLINKKFDINNPDERRIPWNQLGEEFWQPQRD